MKVKKGREEIRERGKRRGREMKEPRDINKQRCRDKGKDNDKENSVYV